MYAWDVYVDVCMGCMCGMYASDVCMGCICGMYVWDVYVGCMCGMYAYDACVWCRMYVCRVYTTLICVE